MTSKFLRFTLAPAALIAISALAQTGSAATPSGSAAPLPTAPPTAATGATNTTAPNTGTKVGEINIDGAILGTNEGRRDMEALGKKFEPKQTELKSQNDELETLKKQLNTQGDKLNE